MSTERKKPPKEDEAVAKYAAGEEQLDAALAGLSDKDLDLSRAEGKWTIREIVHHIADAEDIWKTCVKAALGNPGCTVDLNWYIADNKCAEPLDYRHRPIEDAVALFKATRRHLAQLVRHLPDALDRSFTITRNDLPKGKTFKVGGVMGFQALHLRRHIKQIEETRKQHGV